MHPQLTSSLALFNTSSSRMDPIWFSQLLLVLIIIETITVALAILVCMLKLPHRVFNNKSRFFMLAPISMIGYFFKHQVDVVSADEYSGLIWLVCFIGGQDAIIFLVLALSL